MKNTKIRMTLRGFIGAAFTLTIAAGLASCATNRFDTSASGLKHADFKKVADGKHTDLYRLTNKSGMEVCITNYGARVVSIMVPDREGKMENVVRGFDNIDEYMQKSQNYGATVGRYIGRILNAQYTMDGATYHLQANHPDGHTAHGGNPNFGARMWKKEHADAHSVTLSYLSPDGENGFPGNLKIMLTYRVTEDNSLDIQYKATTDKATVINSCNHSFFNLSGDMTRNVEAQTLWVDADYFTPYDNKKCVTGAMWPVQSTPLDFREPHVIGTQINTPYSQLKVTKGYDHAWVLRSPGVDSRPAATIYDEQSGRLMEVFTTEPAMHIYSGNGMKDVPRGAICFETCHFQDSPNNPQFPSTALRPGEVFQSHTAYRFSVVKR